jgi:hypothetical protein
MCYSVTLFIGMIFFFKVNFTLNTQKLKSEEYDHTDKIQIFLYNYLFSKQVYYNLHYQLNNQLFNVFFKAYAVRIINILSEFFN